MTIEAWVRPTALGNIYRTVVMKEQPGRQRIRAVRQRLRERPGADRRDVHQRLPGAIGTAQLPLNTWTHLAATYNGNVLALYVNGTQAAQLLVTGAVATSASPLKLGGNAIWGEWFAGQIDEVRIYNRALTATEIQADMNRPITNADTVRAVCAGRVVGDGWVELGVVVVGGGDGRRRCGSLQRAPRHDERVHADGGEPDRAADRLQLHGQRSRRAPTSTGSPPRTRPATSARPRTRPRDGR